MTYQIDTFYDILYNIIYDRMRANTRQCDPDEAEVEAHIRHIATQLVGQFDDLDIEDKPD